MIIKNLNQLKIWVLRSHETSCFMKEANLDNYGKRKALAHACTNKRQCKVQITGQWLRKTFPGAVFSLWSTNLPEKQFRICLKEDKMVELLQDSTQNFKSNMLDQYLDRPAVSFCGGKCVNQFYSVEFLRYHCLKKKKRKKKKNKKKKKI